MVNEKFQVVYLKIIFNNGVLYSFSDCRSKFAPKQNDKRQKCKRVIRVLVAILQKPF